ncbi:MAG: Spx/MgsR family RNA polymerase-binding regulatory protein [Acidobacteriota bacterium]|nr:Spx/MgsR family RNA polymerase-binding regulatory protein [Acidobacteriota bacterium]
MLTMLGIPNCDTVKKARKHLEANQVPFQFRDLRKQPLDREEWAGLIAQDDSGKLINTRGPSFRKAGIPKEELNPGNSLQVLLEHPTAMKRPVMTEDGRLLSIGFSPEIFQAYINR